MTLEKFTALLILLLIIVWSVCIGIGIGVIWGVLFCVVELSCAYISYKIT